MSRKIAICDFPEVVDVVSSSGLLSHFHTFMAFSRGR